MPKDLREGLYNIESSWEDGSKSGLDTDAIELGARLAFGKRDPRTLQISPSGRCLLDNGSTFALYESAHQEEGGNPRRLACFRDICLAMSEEGDIYCQVSILTRNGELRVFYGPSLLHALRAATDAESDLRGQAKQVREETEKSLKRALRATGRKDD